MDEERLKVRARYERDRWIANVPQIPGCRVYGSSRSEALAKGKARALRAVADVLERGAVDTVDCMFEEAHG